MGGKMKKTLLAVSLVTIFSVQPVWGANAKLAASSSLPNTNIAMKNPGFWIARHPFPDKVILSPSGVEAFNRGLMQNPGLVADPANIDASYPGDELRSMLEKDFRDVASQVLYDDRGKKVNEAALKKIKDNMALDLVYKKCITRYGVVRTYTDQRILPSDDIMAREPGDTEFDRLQQSSLDIGTQLAILHESIDHKWLYARTPSSWGWVRKDSVAFCSADALKRIRDSRPFIVVTAPKADIYLDGALTSYYETVRMGARFPAYEKAEHGMVMVRVPIRGDDGRLSEMTAFIKRADVNFGYLPYTPRSVIEEAFKLLNAPYGWGGAGQEQDCSAFLQEVFATVGIILPRNSAEQEEAGYLLAEFSDKTPDTVKFDMLAREAVGGITTLGLKGHIMLYLGIYGLKPYAIHATYGYAEKTGMGEVDRVVNRVAVSDLSLGAGSNKGSLLERLGTVRLMADEDVKAK